MQRLATLVVASSWMAAAAAPLSLSVLAGAQTVPTTVAGVTSPAAPAPTPATTSTLPALPVPTLPPLSAPATQRTTTRRSAAGVAPPGSASAGSLSVAPLDTCVSCTSATAGQGSSSSNGTGLRVLGNDVSAGGASGNQQSQGQLIAAPANPLVSLAVADWMASAQSGAGGSTASSRSALADVAVAGGQVATVAILESASSASWSGSPSSSSSAGSASSNGVDANVGQGALVIILLHSDASSGGGGSSQAYVASINGNEILSSSQLGQPIVVTVPGVVTLTLLDVSAAGGQASAAVATVTDRGGVPGEQAGAFAVGVRGTTGSTSSTSPVGAVQAAQTVPVGPAVGTPSTGAALGLLGLIVAGGGLAAVAGSRVRRRGC